MREAFMREASTKEISTLEIRNSYLPGAIGQITALHATYYSQHWGLDLNFEAEVAAELSEFLLRFNPEQDGLWLAVLHQTIVGSIVVDGGKSHSERDSKSDDEIETENEIKSARLRWFILAPECQGLGIGQRLLEEAIEFCRQAKFSQIYLWTFAGLRAARHLYEKYEFILCEEYKDQDWGNQVIHQKFKKIL